MSRVSTSGPLEAPGPCLCWSRHTMGYAISLVSIVLVRLCTHVWCKSTLLLWQLPCLKRSASLLEGLLGRRMPLSKSLDSLHCKRITQRALTRLWVNEGKLKHGCHMANQHPTYKKDRTSRCLPDSQLPHDASPRTKSCARLSELWFAGTDEHPCYHWPPRQVLSRHCESWGSRIVGFCATPRAGPRRPSRATWSAQCLFAGEGCYLPRVAIPCEMASRLVYLQQSYPGEVEADSRSLSIQ